MTKLTNTRRYVWKKRGLEAKLSTVTTPYIKEQAKENCARKPEFEGQESVQCRWCKHAFSMPGAEDVQFSNGRLVHCPWCDLPLNWRNLGPATTLQGQLSRGNKPPKKVLPSLAVNKDEKVNLQYLAGMFSRMQLTLWHTPRACVFVT